MEISPINTHWALVCGILSDSSPERFLIDTYYAYLALLQMGVPDANIDVIIEPIPATLSPIITTFSTTKSFKAMAEFDDVVLNNPLENLMIVLNGHGSIEGLDSTNNLKPYPLTSMIHARDNLKYCAVIFGQCFAGIYNYTDLIKRNSEGKNEKTPVVCFIGASHLNSSISGTATLSGGFRWVANIFLFYFFDWLIIQKDIDGDGQSTLMDAFKYAGARASGHLISLKTDSSSLVRELSKALDKIEEELTELEKDKVKNSTQIAEQGLEKDSVNRKITDTVGITHTNQARNFIFSK